ncbi:MAG: hypothetical protein IOC90_12825 [Methylocystis sp.]|nr:hypothetical protein [Methylocystis sp.]MCA3583039.1 hypothetical protein [Methylocystis sp.]MCA3588897.1 hypothetical protein [Methylocystis sp.]MCA3590444.1 hypothetical protein [Methylocystis sp.]
MLNVIDGPPEAALDAVDLYESLVQAPTAMQQMAHRLTAAPSDSGGENRPEPAPPEPHGFMRHVDTAFVEQSLDILQMMAGVSLARRAAGQRGALARGGA